MHQVCSDVSASVHVAWKPFLPYGNIVKNVFFPLPHSCSLFLSLAPKSHMFAILNYEIIPSHSSSHNERGMAIVKKKSERERER